jgi:hypothetical protein
MNTNQLDTCTKVEPQEWTPEYVENSYYEDNERWTQNIADAHNAALAAQAYQYGLVHAETLKQLAVAQERIDQLLDPEER